VHRYLFINFVRVKYTTTRRLCAARMLSDCSIHCLHILYFKNETHYAAVQCFFKGFWLTEKFSQKQYNLALRPPPKYIKTLFYNHLGIWIEYLRLVKLS